MLSNLPTDRLHKFATVGGLTLLLVGFSIPLQKYMDAEGQRIEAVARMQSTHFTYSRYARQVNQTIAISNDAATRDLTGAAREEARLRILALNPEAERLSRETELALTENLKAAELAVHFGFISNLWFALGLLCILAGASLAGVGIRQWMAQPPQER
jgi:hypothetical protein